MDIVYGIDLLGTLVFAISGVLAAIEKKFDLVGSFILGFVTALGGGTLRDVLIGVTPVSWMQDLNYFFVILAALPICYLGRSKIARLRKSFFLFDTIGIALFTVLGLQKTLGIGLSPVIGILMGVVSAVFGGIIRDVLSNEVPLIFRREIYAAACFVGALLFYVTGLFSPWEEFNLIFSMTVVIVIRYLSVKNKWTLYVKPLT